LVIGCLPIFGLRLSTLECLYSPMCLQKLSNLTKNIYNNLWLLNISIPSRFTPVSSTLIRTLIDESFIESWHIKSNYSNYFEICAPSTCQYTYEKRHDALYILTTFLGLYGGLTVGLKLIVWYVLCITAKVQEYLIDRRRRVEPINEW
ncbi:unnamed protein product, partial [Rotaria sp. Silwood2]